MAGANLHFMRPRNQEPYFVLADVGVKKLYQKKHLSMYLLRQAINEADRRKMDLQLDVHPRSIGRKKLTEKEWKDQRIIVAELYRQFGFEYTDYKTLSELNQMTMIRRYRPEV